LQPNATGAESQKLGNLANMWFPPQLTIAPPIPCLVRKTTHQLHQLAHPRYICICICIHNMHKLMQTCIYMLDHPALWMFLTPGPSFVEKYIHVRRAWPSLGQVHSEFGSELEQPLATRLHWTKGNRNMSDKLSKTENNTKISQRKSFKNNISQTLASLPGTQMIVQTFFWTEPKTIIIVTLLLSFLTVTPRGTLDFKALYVSLCCVCQNPISWYSMIKVYDHGPWSIVVLWSWT